MMFVIESSHTPIQSRKASSIVTMNSHQRSTLFANRQAARPLHVIVVGAGMAGLTAGLGLQLTGHRVTILEQAPTFQQDGAGIQIAPNAARVLDRFGVLADVLKDADLLERISQRQAQACPVRVLFPCVAKLLRRAATIGDMQTIESWAQHRSCQAPDADTGHQSLSFIGGTCRGSSCWRPGRLAAKSRRARRSCVSTGPVRRAC